MEPNGWLHRLEDDCDGAATDLRDRLARWSTKGRRASPAGYTRRATLIISAIGALVTVGANVSSIHIEWRSCGRNAALREVVAVRATAAATLEDLSRLKAGGPPSLETLALGWQDTPAARYDVAGMSGGTGLSRRGTKRGLRVHGWHRRPFDAVSATVAPNATMSYRSVI